MNNELNSVEDIDAMLEKEFKLDQNVDNNNEETDEETDKTEEKVNNETINNDKDVSKDTEETDNSEKNDENDKSSEKNEEQNDENSNLEQNKDNGKHSKEEKEDYSFAQLRKENADIKAQLKMNSSYAEMIKVMAAQNGYSDIDKFISDYNDAIVIQEAKDKGYDPVLYKELQNTKQKVEQLENNSRQAQLQEKANSFKSAIDAAVKDYNLGKDGQNEIFTRLENAGFTADNILNLPNPKIVIDGVLSDKIAEMSQQKQISKLEKLDNLVDGKHDGSNPTKTFSLDELIAEDLKDFKANQL